MGCTKCRKKGLLTLKCRDCSGEFCTGCIQLETHMCPMLSARKQIEKNDLSSKLVKVEASKVIKI